MKSAYWGENIKAGGGGAARPISHDPWGVTLRMLHLLSVINFYINTCEEDLLT